MPRPADGREDYYPALDGVRAIAVTMVVASHLGLPHADGGLLGVSVFFTLSGFLITGVLLRRHALNGTLGLSGFWIHRARRLVPALVLVLVTVLSATMIGERAELGTRVKDALAAAFYVGNWANIAEGRTYFDLFAGPQPFEHLWSLAIEEQFYLAWPLLLMFLLRLRRVGRIGGVAITLALAGGSFVLMALLAHPGLDQIRTYQGTDARMGELLVGAALALAFDPRRTRTSTRLTRRVLDVVGVVGLLGLGVLAAHADYLTMFIYHGGLIMTAMASAALILAATWHESWVSRSLGTAPLRWIGERSYGIYLWHMPVIAFSPLFADGAQQRPAHWAAWAAVDALIVVVLAALSWRLVEEPIRHLGFMRALRGRPEHSAAAAVKNSATRRRSHHRSVATGAMSLVAVATAVVTTVGTSWSAADTPKSPGDARTVEDSATGNGSPTERLGTSCTAVNYIGDSTSVDYWNPGRTREHLRAELRKVGVRRTSTADINSGLSIDGNQPGNSQTGLDVTRARIASGFNGCWIVAFGADENLNSPDSDAADIDARIDQMMSAIREHHVLWFTVRTRLRSGPFADKHMTAWNSALVRACQRYPQIRVFDWAAELPDDWFTSDGVHYNPTGYAERTKRVARALALAFPRKGQTSGCLVSSGLPTNAA